MAEAQNPTRKSHKNPTHLNKVEERPPPSWESLKCIFSNNPQQPERVNKKKKKKKKNNNNKNKNNASMRCSVSICNTRESSEVLQRHQTHSPKDRNSKSTHVSRANSCNRSKKTPLKEINGPLPSSNNNAPAKTSGAPPSASNGGPFKAMQFRRFSGCYECHTVVDPIGGLSRDPSLRSAICPCPDCGQVFMKPENLELHQAVRHAVSELGPEDTSRNIVEIIFQSSWLKKDAPACKIDRILKINNTQKTISRFEEYRDVIKTRARQLRKYPRCIADGNELLRFHYTTFTCSIGLKGSTSLCHSIPSCKACSIIRDGFKADPSGRIRTMATSGRAHDTAIVSSEGEKRAMLVCRVIAGRIKKSQDSTEECDSVTGPLGAYSTLDELFVSSARAILPCFLVIYREV